MTVLNSTEDLPRYLVEVLPQSTEAVEEVRLEYRDDPAIRTFGYVSLAFWWPVMAGVNKNTYGGVGDIPGLHYHLYDTKMDGFGTVDGVPTSWVKIYVADSGSLGTVFPVIR